MKYVCDYIIHCTDKSDEIAGVCASWNCTTGRWKCKNNKCIESNKVCDGKKVSAEKWSEHGYDEHACKDDSDEDPVMCKDWECVEGMWTCKKMLGGQLCVCPSREIL